jgi:phosphoribosylformylglycinamidine synthase
MENTMKRILIEKREGFNQEASALNQQCQSLLNINVQCRLINGYEVTHLENNDLEEAIRHVFSEPMVDKVLRPFDFNTKTMLAREPVPGQYDQRADSAEQCLRLLNVDNQSKVTTFQLVIFDRALTETERQRFIRYWINPVEMREKRFDETEMHTVPEAGIELTGFIHWSKDQCESFRQTQGAAMRLEDVLLIQAYFKEHMHRDLAYTEFKVLDTYWSDHCRHTTFESVLDDIVIEEGPLAERYQTVLQAFLQERIQLKRSDRPLTLMEMATHMDVSSVIHGLKTVTKSMPAVSW